MDFRNVGQRWSLRDLRQWRQKKTPHRVLSPISRQIGFSSSKEVERDSLILKGIGLVGMPVRGEKPRL